MSDEAARVIRQFATRTLVIGDIHGCADELSILIDHAVVDHPATRVISLGDIFDKGPDPLACLAMLDVIGAEMIAANHEEWHVKWWRRERDRIQHGKPNNMKPHDPRDIEINAQLTEAQVDWLASRPPWLEIIPGWVAVHGGFNPTKSIADQDPTKVVRLRYVDAAGDHVAIDYDAPGGPRQPEGTTHWTDRWNGPENVVYGHEAFSLTHPRIVDSVNYAGKRITGEELKNFLWAWEGDPMGVDLDGKPVQLKVVRTYGIDTGCVHGGHLSALLFDQDPRNGMVGIPQLIQVQARRVYQKPMVPIPDPPDWR